MYRVCSAHTLKKLLKYLDQLGLNGDIFYGFHVSNASVMSCYIRDSDYGYIDFVDGMGGGYTQASVILKGKLRERA